MNETPTTSTTLPDRFAVPSSRAFDGLGREWALTRNGSWACLGHAITVDSLDELDARYIITAVSR